MIGNSGPATAEHEGAARIALGFDPGAAHVGWCALAAERGSVRYVAAGVLEIEPSDPGLAALRLAARDLLVTHRPDIVGIERVIAVFVRGRFGASMASGLVGAAWTGGELAACFAVNGIEIKTLAHTAVKVAIGAPAGDGRAVTAALRARVQGWPGRVNEHARDAGAVALAVLSDG